MAVIPWKSNAVAPGTLEPAVERVHMGHYFVTIHYAGKRVAKGDQDLAVTNARKISAVGGKEKPMFVNEVHPADEEQYSGSKYTGSSDEMHDEFHRLAHYHIQLVGAQRDKGLQALGVWDTIIEKLKILGWD